MVFFFFYLVCFSHCQPYLLRGFCKLVELLATEDVFHRTKSILLLFVLEERERDVLEDFRTKDGWVWSWNNSPDHPAGLSCRVKSSGRRDYHVLDTMDHLQIFASSSRLWYLSPWLVYHTQQRARGESCFTSHMVCCWLRWQSSTMWQRVVPVLPLSPKRITDHLVTKCPKALSWCGPLFLMIHFKILYLVECVTSHLVMRACGH